MLSEQAGCLTGRGRSHLGGGFQKEDWGGWRSTSGCPIGRQANLHSVCPSQPEGRMAQLPELIPQWVTASHSHQRKADGFQRDPLCPPLRLDGFLSRCNSRVCHFCLPEPQILLAGSHESLEKGRFWSHGCANPAQIPIPGPECRRDLFLLARHFIQNICIPHSNPRRPSKQIINNSER